MNSTLFISMSIICTSRCRAVSRSHSSPPCTDGSTFPIWSRSIASFRTCRSFPSPEAQREPLPGANWAATVYHGLPTHLYRFRSEPGNYFAFLGRISPEKRVDSAIAIARERQRPIRIAAKVDRVDKEYFESVVKPLLCDPLVDFVGEIGEDEKDEFLGNAYALLFPIDWPEPFGLVMIEARPAERRSSRIATGSCRK